MLFEAGGPNCSRLQTWKVYWSMEDVHTCAKRLHKLLPDSVIDLINSGKFKGHVIHMADAMVSNLDDIKNNAIFLQALFASWPDRVPSGYLCADVLLALDALLDGKLLPGDAKTKIQLAMDNGPKLKKT